MVAKPSLGSMVDTAHAFYTNLLGSYLFNEASGTTAADSSGNGNDFNINLTAIAWGSSSIFTSSPALICSATAGITGGTPISFVGLGTTFSIELWITYQTSDTYAMLFGGNTVTHDAAIGVFLHSGKLDLYRITDHDGTAALSSGTSYHLFITYDGTNARYYINATLDATVAVSLGSLFGNDYIVNDPGSETFVGTYDILRFWGGRVFNSTEITDIYNDPFGMYGDNAEVGGFFFAS